MFTEPDDSKIFVINTDPVDRPANPAAANPLKWLEVIGTVQKAAGEARYRETFGIAAVDRPDYMVLYGSGALNSTSGTVGGGSSGYRACMTSCSR